MTEDQSAAARAFARLRSAMAVDGLTGSEKGVLLVLAIMANGQGVAWPSITQIAARASIGRRTAFEALARLDELELIEREPVPGKGTRYRLPPDWCASRTSAPPAPVRQPHSTGAPPAPKQPENNHRRKKTTSSPSTRPAADPYPRPDGVDPQAWADFLANRKRKRLPNTATAHKTLMDDLARHATDAWPAPRLIAYAAGKGWASVRIPDGEARDVRPLDRPGRSAPGVRGTRPDPALDMLYAARAAEEANSPAGDWSHDRGAWPALPAYGGG